MSRPYGRHIDDLPVQQFYAIILAQDARLHHAMEVLGGKPMRDQLHCHAVPPALTPVETPHLLTSTGRSSRPLLFLPIWEASNEIVTCRETSRARGPPCRQYIILQPRRPKSDSCMCRMHRSLPEEHPSRGQELPAGNPVDLSV